jgi:hypothetical protein
MRLKESKKISEMESEMEVLKEELIKGKEISTALLNILSGMRDQKVMDKVEKALENGMMG